jgi:two-component system, OmpR family, osmolarity sensor histidine kinase EnvZ
VPTVTFLRFRSILPRGLFGRATLILVLPIVAIQLIVSTAFLQRHFEGVTRQMTQGIATELGYVLDGADLSFAEAARRAEVLGMKVAPGDPAELAVAENRYFYDWSGWAVIQTLREKVRPGIGMIDLVSLNRTVRLVTSTANGPLEVQIDRRRVSASNPHQLLVLMVFASLLLTLIAYFFLRNQLKPITALAEAASAFGKGRHVPYRPRGAVEVRAAGTAFLDMRARIERQIEQRTLLLSGVSHDLRTPLTRLRLGLAMQPETEDTEALLADVADMERLVDEFLAFVRGDAMEGEELVDPVALVDRVIEASSRAGGKVIRGNVSGDGQVRLRPMAVSRALENLISNGLKFGTMVQVGLTMSDRMLRFTVEDDGPGIPKDLRDEAMRPFVRLSEARDPNRGGGVGLGLSIAADIARNHGGALRLSDSAAHGGLKAELEIAR